MPRRSSFHDRPGFLRLAGAVLMAACLATLSVACVGTYSSSGTIDVPTTATMAPGDAVGSSSATTYASGTTTTISRTTTVPADLPVIAWQPSHQDDTGYNDWHEYQICSDIVQRTMALSPEFTHVLAWETGMGLTGTNNRGGTNRGAFDSELRMANEAGADCFISVHNDGSGVSGVMGMYFAGDTASAKIADALAEALAEGLGIPHRKLVGRDLYSLDPVRNKAPIRILLEIGDNSRDRALLEDPLGRAHIANLLARALPAVLGVTTVGQE